MTDRQPDLPELIRQVRERLALDAALGVSDVVLPRIEPPVPAAAVEPAGAGQPRRSPAATRASRAATRAPATPKTLDAAAKKKAAALAKLEKQVAQCKLCGLCEGRTHLVFGAGHPDARLMFVGEAPGADEDRQGEPFVGRAGQLLTRIITQGMKLQRSDVYIANILKCRPPGNRTPSPTEMALCKPHLVEQIKIIQPEIIMALGAVALNALTDSHYAITKARGRFLEWQGAKLMPTFHPAYLLRNPRAKKEVWEDIKKVMAALAAKA